MVEMDTPFMAYSISSSVEMTNSRNALAGEEVSQLIQQKQL